MQIPNVQILEQQSAKELVTTEDRQRVIGVRTKTQALQADLVVDAAGRGSHAPQWLEGMGFQIATEERVEVGLGYTTRSFRRTPASLDGYRFAVIPPTPEGKRGGVILAQQGDRWIVTLLAYFGNYAPEDVKGFLEYTKTLPGPYIYDAIREAEPLGEAATFRYPASVRRYYEKLTRFPEGFMVFGDAVCSFNPIYGQGMSVAGAEAVILRNALARGSSALAKRFFTAAAKAVEKAWGIAVGGDLRIPETVGQRNAATKFSNWYVAKLHKSAHRDPEATVAFVRVAQFVDEPTSIMAPRIAWRVLCGAR